MLDIKDGRKLTQMKVDPAAPKRPALWYYGGKWRLASWIIYGVSLAHAVLFFRWGLIAGGDNRVPDSQITSNSIALFIATMLMVADTYKSYIHKK